MENASKALIMAASILLGVMILAIGVFLFTTYGQYSKETYEKMEDAQITQFNAQFLKYYGNVATVSIDENGKEVVKEGPILCKAHDVISIANLAHQNNAKYDLLTENTYKENTYYIRVDLAKPDNKSNLEKWNEDTQINFLKSNTSQKYICMQVGVSSSTKRVNYIVFKRL